MRRNAIMRRLAVLAMTAVMILTMSISASAGGWYRVKFSGQMAGTKGKNAYFAIGIDGGGPLYKYNSSTKKKTRIAKGKWSCLNVKGKYLYLAKENHGGSDGHDRYIYRINNSGKNRKKLANGRCPVVKGKYIYYIATKKGYRDGNEKVDWADKGIYRMNLKGKGKKCIVKASNGQNFGNLGVTDGGIIYSTGEDWYKCSYNGKNRKKVDLWSYASNLTIPDYDSYGEYSYLIRVTSNNSEYFAYRNQVKTYQFVNGQHQTKVLASVNGTVKKIIISGSHVMVISDENNSQGSYKYHAYMMNKSGKNIKRVKSGSNVSGGWDA